ncbi:MAG: hypothetical protein WKF42_06430 [Solirubrobacteraceae bacterium]
MTRPLARIVRLTFVTLLALAGLFGGHAAQADAAPLRLPSIFKPKPPLAATAKRRAKVTVSTGDLSRVILRAWR